MPGAIIAMSSKNVFPDSPIIFRSNQRVGFFPFPFPSDACHTGYCRP